MAETIFINKNLTDEEIYKSLIPQIESLINSHEPIISNLSNFTSVLKEAFDKISWVGFYLLQNGKLFLGPFQGKNACTVIEIGKGVCGTSILQRETIIVQDVEKYPGHIVCDSNSRSEIVIPLKKDNNIFGVLDLDSNKISAFNEIDKNFLELFCSILTQKLSFERLIL